METLDSVVWRSVLLYRGVLLLFVGYIYKQELYTLFSRRNDTDPNSRKDTTQSILEPSSSLIVQI